MKARILRPEEWGRIDTPDIAALLPYVEPQNIAVCVVEDDAGEIVGCLSALRATHLEGLWVAPERRGNAGIIRALLRQAVAVAQVRGEHFTFGISDGDTCDYMRRLGGHVVPGTFYALPIGDSNG